MRLPLLLSLLPLVMAVQALGSGRPMTVDDLLAVKSVSDPQLSPDGTQIVYVVSEVDRSADRSNSDLWLVSTSGGEPRRLTTAPGADSHPRWSPDGKSIAFTSTRGGSSQVWLLPLEGGEARPLTRLPIDVSGPIWSPTGDKLVVAGEVYPGKTPEETAAKDKEKGESKSKARAFDRLMIRHWQSWDEGKRSHLFVVDANTGKAKDVTPDLEVNTPPAPFGGSSDYAFSPDGTRLAFTAEPKQDHPWSTNTDIYEVGLEEGALRNLTLGNPAADAQPAYSPDGRWLAFVRQDRAGFESDQWVLALIHRGTGKASLLNRAIDRAVPMTQKLDRPIHSFTWAGDHRLLAVIDDKGTEPVVEVRFSEIADGASVTVMPAGEFSRAATGGVTTAVSASGDRLALLRSEAARPAEVFAAKGDGSELTRLTRHNDPLVESLDVHGAEGFTFSGADGDEVSGWLIRPPGFDPSKKYPVVFLIHGGPQGAWHDEWHGRWNYQMFASPGFAVVAINPRGSTGYGQKFTDQISGDWTGRVYEDLMKGLDHALATYPFLDGDKVAAAGGSYGGFMVNWIAGHTDRFKALISHAGVFDLTSKYGTTEELWFPEWEFGGTPWEKPEAYLEKSPSRFAGNFKTPTLVIHGALDFRVPDAQGLGMFTTLQRLGVPSRYLYFPDEGHWIQKPANRVVWWDEMLGWLTKYLKS